MAFAKIQTLYVPRERTRIKGLLRASKSASLTVDFLYTARKMLDIMADSKLPGVFMKDKLYRGGLVAVTLEACTVYQIN